MCCDYNMRHVLVFSDAYKYNNYDVMDEHVYVLIYVLQNNNGL